MNLFKIFCKSEKELTEKRKKKLLNKNPQLREIINLMKESDDLDKSVFPDTFAERVYLILNNEV